MRLRIKLLVTSLVTLFLVGGGGVAIHQGLLVNLEFRLHDQRIIESEREILAGGVTELLQYHKSHQERFKVFSEKEAFREVFQANQSSANVQSREKDVGTLFQEIPSFRGIRVFDMDGRKIHYSSFKEDRQSVSTRFLTYKNVDSVEGGKKLFAFTRGKMISIYRDSERVQFVYGYPAYDLFGIQKGRIFFFVGVEELGRQLAKRGLFSRANAIHFVGDQGILLGLKDGQMEIALPRVASLWRGGSVNSVEHVVSDEGSTEKFYLLTEKILNGYVGILIPGRVLTVSPIVWATLLVVSCTIVFLLVFLLLSLKQDPVVILANRIKRFQLHFLKDYVENKEAIDWGWWEAEFVRKKEEMKTYLLRGLKGGDQKKMNYLVEKGWQSLISIITGYRREQKEKGGATRAEADFERIEGILQKILSAGGKLSPPPQNERILDHKEKVQVLPSSAKEWSDDDAEEIEELGDDEAMASDEKEETPVDLEDLVEEELAVEEVIEEVEDSLESEDFLEVEELVEEESLADQDSVFSEIEEKEGDKVEEDVEKISLEDFLPEKKSQRPTPLLGTPVRDLSHRGDIAPSHETDNQTSDYLALVGESNNLETLLLSEEEMLAEGQGEGGSMGRKQEGWIASSQKQGNKEEHLEELPPLKDDEEATLIVLPD